MFSALLFIGHHFAGEGVVGFLGGSARARAGDGTVLDFAVVDLDEKFG